MPKRRPGTPQRKSRRRGRPPIRAPLSQVAPQPVAPAGEGGRAPPTATAVAERRPADRGEASVTRFTARDYGYVVREVRRIVVLAAGIIAVLIVLSFFVP